MIIMTRSEALQILDTIPTIGEQVDALEMAISALELITHLNNRPCEACEYHSDNGCSKWDCVFDELVYWDRRQEWRKNNVDSV